MVNLVGPSAPCILLVALCATLAQAQTKQDSCIVEPKGTPSALVVAVESGDLRALSRLLALGAKVDELHYEHETALMVAARGGRTEMVRALLDAGADVNKQTSLGWTALMWSGQKGRAEIISVLLAAGVDVNARNKEGWTALMWAARDGNAESVESLLASGAETSAENEQGRDVFLLAAEGGQTRVVEKFLAAGADANMADKYGTTALMMAARSPETVKVLLDAGTVVDAKTEPLGMTALYMAAMNGWAEPVRLLIKAGANVNAKDMDGRTPLNRARVGKHAAVVELLKSAGAVE